MALAVWQNIKQRAYRHGKGVLPMTILLAAFVNCIQQFAYPRDRSWESLSPFAPGLKVCRSHLAFGGHSLEDKGGVSHG